MPDAVVIGGGPAGLSAALTLRARGKTVTVVSAGETGSHLYKAERVENYPGLPGVSGKDLLSAMTNHALSQGAELLHGRATSAMPMGKGFGVAVGSDYLDAGCLILTVGVSMGKPYPGETEFLGRGVSYCATCDGMMYRSKHVAVIGLCNAAAEEAAFLRSIGCQVEYFDKARAKQYEIRGSQTVTELIADGVSYPVQGVFLLRDGVAPDALLPGLALEGGAIRVDGNMAASIPGVFAAGDCTGTPYQVAKAVGEGNIAALSAVKYLDTKEN